MDRKRVWFVLSFVSVDDMVPFLSKTSPDTGMINIGPRTYTSPPTEELIIYLLKSMDEYIGT